MKSPPDEVWLFEDKSGGFYITNEQESTVKFESTKQRDWWLSFFPDVVCTRVSRHQGRLKHMNCPQTKVEEGKDVEQEIVTTAIIKINPKDDMVVLSLLAQADGLLRVAKARVIATDEGMKLATDDMAIIAGVSKALAEKKEEYYRPVKAHLDDISASFQTLMAPILEADRITRGKWTAYRNEQKRKKAEADETNRMALEVAHRQEAATGEHTVDLRPVEVPVPIAHIRTDLGSAGVTRNRKWRLLDITKVPAEYLMVNEALVGKVVRAGIPAIAGLELYFEESLHVTPKTS